MSKIIVPAGLQTAIAEAQAYREEQARQAELEAQREREEAIRREDERQARERKLLVDVFTEHFGDCFAELGFRVVTLDDPALLFPWVGQTPQAAAVLDLGDGLAIRMIAGEHGVRGWLVSHGVGKQRFVNWEVCRQLGAKEARVQFTQMLAEMIAELERHIEQEEVLA